MGFQINDHGQLLEVGDGSSVSGVRFDLNVFVLIGALAVMVITVAAAVWAVCDGRSQRNESDEQAEHWRQEFTSLRNEQHDTKTQCWLSERRLMDMEAYAMLNGWKVPGDTQHGPTGNIERMTGKEIAHGRK